MNFAQIQTIVWLRWHLTRNQFIRGGAFNAVLSFIMLALLLVGAVGFGVGGVFAGMFGLPKAPPDISLLIWDAGIGAFLFIWFTGLMVEIQRSESIDLTKLLHLPVTLRQVFVFNYIASHVTTSILLFLPLLVGAALGLVIASGPSQAILVFVVLGLFFMATAWTYCLRGWLAALMVNKRRRRTIVVWITIAFVLAGQLPNLFFNSHWFVGKTRSGRPASGIDSGHFPGSLKLPNAFVKAHWVVPPGWVGYSALSLNDHRIWPALAAAAASWLIGTLGLARAYRMTIRFYQGADEAPSAQIGKQIARPPASLDSMHAKPLALKTLLVERTLPWLPDDTAALTLATFRSLLRAPELKMALIMPAVILLVMLLPMRHGHSMKGIAPYLSTFAGTAVVAMAAFAIAPTMANTFGLDRSGFRTLVLLPTRRHHILLAKNLAHLPFIGLIAVVLLAVAEFLFRMPFGTFLAACVQVPLAFVLFSLVCNLASILVPYRLAPGTLQAKKPKAIAMIAVLAMFFMLPILMLPLLIPPGLQLLFDLSGWLPWLPVNLLASVILLGVSVLLYWVILPFEGRLLQRREQIILKEVTEETE